MTQFRISAKQLGSLAMEHCCPRCFYIGYHIQFKYPGVVATGMNKTGIELLLQSPSKELIIIDFKTSSPKDGFDPFMPIYDIQLQGYAKILEDMGFG